MHNRPAFPSNLQMPLGVVQPSGDIKFKEPKTHAEFMALLHLCLIHMTTIHDCMRQINERAAAHYLKEGNNETLGSEPSGSDIPGTGSL